MTGAFSSSQASMMAWSSSILLTLKAPSAYLPLSALANKSLVCVSGIVVFPSAVDILQGFDLQFDLFLDNDGAGHGVGLGFAKEGFHFDFDGRCNVPVAIAQGQRDFHRPARLQIKN